jgi:hypothetical protein
MLHFLLLELFVFLNSVFFSILVSVFCFPFPFVVDLICSSLLIMRHPQFPDVVTFCEEMANYGKTVIVAALDGTFQRKPFGKICELVPLAESVVKLTAVCQICQASAAFSKRLGDEKQIELIGGADKYIAVCRHCYHDAFQAQSTSTL